MSTKTKVEDVVKEVESLVIGWDKESLTKANPRCLNLCEDLDYLLAYNVSDKQYIAVKATKAAKRILPFVSPPVPEAQTYQITASTPSNRKVYTFPTIREVCELIILANEAILRVDELKNPKNAVVASSDSYADILAVLGVKA